MKNLNAKARFNPAWCLLAGLCIGVGSVGALLPLLPTTPFLLLAAFAASRGSPRMSGWIESHPRIGPLLQHWRENRALAPRTKVLALATLAGGWLLMIGQVQSPAFRLVASLVILTVATFLATRPAPAATPTPGARVQKPFL